MKKHEEWTDDRSLEGRSGKGFITRSFGEVDARLKFGRNPRIENTREFDRASERRSFEDNAQF